MKILLVHPGDPDDILTRISRDIPYLDAAAFFAPHALAAVAAVTPAGHEVRIHDENLHGPVDDRLAAEAPDVVGATLSTSQFRRTVAILEAARRAVPGARRVVGGIGASALMGTLRAVADTLFLGEVEDTWPVFLADLAAGRAKDTYETVSRPDMARTPPPRWDLVARDVRRYVAPSVQTARGCPFDCAFCDVIYTYGRRLRQKPVDRVLDEVAALERLNPKGIMFADDNFAADRKYAKELLRRLGPLNDSFRFRLPFLTQLDITIADDEELLELLADANFTEVQIGVESTDPEALKAMDKHQNLRRDPVASVRRIQSYGIAVMAHMIIGTDADDRTAFDRTARFLADANVTHHQWHPLMAPPGTRMWYDLKRQGRLVEYTEDLRSRLDVLSNVVPKRMSRVDLMEGLADYLDRVHEPDAYLPRALGFLDGIRRVPRVAPPGPAAARRAEGLMDRIVRHFLDEAEGPQRAAFLSVLRATRDRAPWAMDRMMFVHTAYRMDRMRARHDAAVAREQAAVERADPGAVRVLSPDTRLSPDLRRLMPDIARTAFGALRPRVAGRSELVHLALAALRDYNDRYGAELAVFDDAQRDHLLQACDRVLARATPSADPPDPLPADAPPPFFARDLLDALDRTLRVASGG
jgi:radical SAM superfamily enzyme YgiQ (UPF0313 family)